MATKERARLTKGMRGPAICTNCKRLEPECGFYSKGFTKYGTPQRTSFCRDCAPLCASHYKQGRRVECKRDPEVPWRRASQVRLAANVVRLEPDYE